MAGDATAYVFFGSDEGAAASAAAAAYARLEEGSDGWGNETIDGSAATVDEASSKNTAAIHAVIAALKEAGVKRINFSLDTLDPERYAYITPIGKLDDSLAGLHAALAAGFEKVKINAVLIGGFNDDEILDLANLTKQYPVDMRFIEMMPMYDSGDFPEAAFIPYTKVLEQLPDFLTHPAEEGSYGEWWSLRKMLRRFLWHDRIHAKAMWRTATALWGSEIQNPFFFYKIFSKIQTFFSVNTNKKICVFFHFWFP